ncbi:alpha-1,2-fucosyltransferase [Pontibacter sp. H259]|uniref:alpha-1,2-fucosyltransferase n=1 Tax=Pontibacter sp. H259 TaxID=3133421 RepID=UPI0030C299ED
MVIVNYKAGQLANRLFHFAHFISNSIEYNYALINPAFNDYKRFFTSTSANNFGDYKISTSITSKDAVDTLIRKSILGMGKVLGSPLKKTPLYHFHDVKEYDEKDLNYDMNDPEFVNSATKRLTFIDGWLYRDPKNFQKHASALRKIFTPVPEYQQEIDQTIAHCRSLADVVIGVHIRRGDYKTYANGCWYYEDEVYADKMRSLKEQFEAQGKTCVFLVCSNEKINPASYKDLNIVTGDRHFIVDLYCLAGCDYIIGPPSTFTMWASFYGETPLCHLQSKDKQVSLPDFEVVKEG